jgi:hypothetical protein
MIIKVNPVEIGEEAFSLSYLGLPVGTPVADLRSDQRVGYWDGVKLAKQLPQLAVRP